MFLFEKKKFVLVELSTLKQFVRVYQKLYLEEVKSNLIA
jgi:hypothetical protein